MRNIRYFVIVCLSAFLLWIDLQNTAIAASTDQSEEKANKILSLYKENKKLYADKFRQLGPVSGTVVIGYAVPDYHSDEYALGVGTEYKDYLQSLVKRLRLITDITILHGGEFDEEDAYEGRHNAVFVAFSRDLGEDLQSVWGIKALSAFMPKEKISEIVTKMGRDVTCVRMSTLGPLRKRKSMILAQANATSKANECLSQGLYNALGLGKNITRDSDEAEVIIYMMYHSNETADQNDDDLIRLAKQGDNLLKSTR